MKLLLAGTTLLLSLVLVPFALDWRSPVLCALRPQALVVLIAVPAILILVGIRIVQTSRREQRVLRVLSLVGLLAAVLTLAGTLVLEARFRWVRHQVLHADPVRLERLGRHVIVGYRDLAEVSELVRLQAVAGIFIASHNIRCKSVADIRKELDSLQALRLEQSKPPLWVSTDQEGGVVSRLSPPLTRLPALSEVVDSNQDLHQRQRAVREFAATQGRGLAELGVNLNFAPVVDLNYRIVNPDDRYTRISQRAISSDPAVVAKVAEWYCATLEEAGVRCTLKHFPGLGRVFEDTHREHANLAASVAELRNTDWVPFLTMMRRSSAFVMLGHVRLSALDSDHPVSMSHRVIAGMIRGEWKHDGVLITDNFSMAAVYRSGAGMEDGGIEALNSGVDLILISYDPDQYYRVMYALLKADQHGKLDREALKRSDQRLAEAIRSIRN